MTINKRKVLCRALAVLAVVLVFMLVQGESRAAYAGMPDINISITGNDGEGQASSVLQILVLFVVIALVPTILLMMTSFTRVIIVLHFLRSALGTQQMPPNQVLLGIALILSLFIMGPTIESIYEEAYLPYTNGEITTEAFGEQAMGPLRHFMLLQVETEDVGVFAKIAKMDLPADMDKNEIPTSILIPAYLLGELKKGFEYGFWLYVPFIVIDMVVASVLMAMGMMMLPPAMISMPFKILLFVLSDGWRWMMDTIVGTFRLFT